VSSSSLRRRGRPDQVLERQQGGSSMGVRTCTVKRGGRSVGLTVKECEMVEDLFRHGGHVVSGEMLARDVRRGSARATPLDNVIDVTVARLRRKIDDPLEPELIHAVPGVGFVLRAERR